MTDEQQSLQLMDRLGLVAAKEDRLSTEDGTFVAQGTWEWPCSS